MEAQDEGQQTNASQENQPWDFRINNNDANTSRKRNNKTWWKKNHRRGSAGYYENKARQNENHQASIDNAEPQGLIPTSTSKLPDHFHEQPGYSFQRSSRDNDLNKSSRHSFTDHVEPQDFQNISFQSQNHLNDSLPKFTERLPVRASLQRSRYEPRSSYGIQSHPFPSRTTPFESWQLQQGSYQGLHMLPRRISSQELVAQSIPSERKSSRSTHPQPMNQILSPQAREFVPPRFGQIQHGMQPQTPQDRQPISTELTSGEARQPQLEHEPEQDVDQNANNQSSSHDDRPAIVVDGTVRTPDLPNDNSWVSSVDQNVQDQHQPSKSTSTPANGIAYGPADQQNMHYQQQFTSQIPMPFHEYSQGPSAHGNMHHSYKHPNQMPAMMSNYPNEAPMYQNMHNQQQLPDQMNLPSNEYPYVPTGSQDIHHDEIPLQITEPIGRMLRGATRRQMLRHYRHSGHWLPEAHNMHLTPVPKHMQPHQSHDQMPVPNYNGPMQPPHIGPSLTFNHQGQGFPHDPLFNPEADPFIFANGANHNISNGPNNPDFPRLPSPSPLQVRPIFPSESPYYGTPTIQIPADVGMHSEEFKSAARYQAYIADKELQARGHAEHAAEYFSTSPSHVQMPLPPWLDNRAEGERYRDAELRARESAANTATAARVAELPGGPNRKRIYVRLPPHPRTSNSDLRRLNRMIETLHGLVHDGKRKFIRNRRQTAFLRFLDFETEGDALQALGYIDALRTEDREAWPVEELRYVFDKGAQRLAE